MNMVFDPECPPRCKSCVVAYSSMWPAAFRNGSQVYEYAVNQTWTR